MTETASKPATTEIRCPKCGGQSLTLETTEKWYTSYPVIGYHPDPSTDPPENLIMITNGEAAESHTIVDGTDELHCRACGHGWGVPDNVSFKDITEIDGGPELVTIMEK